MAEFASAPSGLRKVFPTASSFVCFLAYVGFFVLHGLLVTASRRGTLSYSFDPTVVVLLSETLKLWYSLGLFAVEAGSVEKIAAELWRARKVFFRYIIPAALYCLYNNLAFVNLTNFDPTTYSLLLQLRIVVVGVAFQIFFKRQLSRVQWLSLGILTMGCVLKQFATPNYGYRDLWNSLVFQLLTWKILLIVIQVMCSSIAGVYNEFLLKDSSAEAPLMVQNVFMYSNSIICNSVLLVFSGDVARLAVPSLWTNVLSDPLAVTIVVNAAAMGLVTAYFLKNLNSILKVHASGMELSFLAVFSFLLFGIPIDGYTILSIVLISVSSYLYAKYPVQNLPRKNGSSSASESV